MIQLDNICRDILEHRKRRVTSAKVIERDADPPVLELLQPPGQLVDAPDPAALRQLQHEALRRDAVLLELTRRVIDQIVIVQLHVGDVDMNFLDRIVPLILPLPEIPQHLVDDPLSHRDDVRRILQDRNEFHRSDPRKPLVLPAKERLTACSPPGSGIDDRLQHDRKSPEIVIDALAHGVPQAQQPGLFQAHLLRVEGHPHDALIPGIFQRHEHAAHDLVDVFAVLRKQHCARPEIQMHISLLYIEREERLSELLDLPAHLLTASALDQKREVRTVHAVDARPP